MEGTIGVVTSVAYDFIPKNWANCSGQLLAIAQNQALFSILGTTYGGNGVNTFALPDLRGRAPISQGNGSSTGLSSYILGEVGGTETATMGISSMPAHTHNGPVSLSLPASTDPGDNTSTENNYIATGTANSFSTNANTTFGAPTYHGTIGTAGGSMPFNILRPYLTLNFVICMYGIFPSRN